METLRPYIPNVLTLARFPLGAAFLICHFAMAPMFGLFIAGVGCITDWLDGFLARRWSVTSDFGKVADAYADKWICWIMTAVAFDILGLNPILITLTGIILVYDLGLSWMRYRLGQRQIPVSWYARAKTTALMCGLLIIYLDWITGSPFSGAGTLLGYATLVASMALALLSIGNYLRGYNLGRYIPYPFSLIL